MLVARPDIVCVYVHDYETVNCSHASSLHHRPSNSRNTLRRDGAVNCSRAHFLLLYSLPVCSRLLLLESFGDAWQVSKYGYIAWSRLFL